MVNCEKYENYLGDPDFLKYGIVISPLVWQKSYSDISAALFISKSYISQVLTRWKQDDRFKDRRVSNGGTNNELTNSKRKSFVNMITEDTSASLKQLASNIEGEHQIKCCQATVSNTLKEIGFIRPDP